VSLWSKLNLELTAFTDVNRGQPLGVYRGFRFQPFKYCCTNQAAKRLSAMRPQLNSSELRIPAKLYRIGELVRYTPFSRQTIHNYTIMGLISEAEWTQGGHRLYDESVFNRLSKIIQLRKTKTLSEIRQILSGEETGCRALPQFQDISTSGEGAWSSPHSAESTKTQSDS